MEKTTNKSGRGGKREGAGRKKMDDPRRNMLPFGVTRKTLERTKRLRELTKHDEIKFVDMFEEWVAQLAQDYGIE